LNCFERGATWYMSSKSRVYMRNNFPHSPLMEIGRPKTRTASNTVFLRRPGALTINRDHFFPFSRFCTAKSSEGMKLTDARIIDHTDDTLAR